MRPVTAVLIVGLLVLLGSVVLLGFALGGPSDGGLAERWVSETSSGILGNHHAPAAIVVDGETIVFAPISGEGGTDQCGLVALDGSDGSQRWRGPVPPANCTIHAVADPTVADYDGDGTREVLAATTEQAVVAYHPRTGDEEFRYELGSYGYTQPLVDDLTGDGTEEVVTVDVRGSVFVARPDGETVWAANRSTYTWGQPAATDFDGDGETELVVALGDGTVTSYEGTGERRWNRTVPAGGNDGSFDGSITWMTTGRIDDEPGRAAIVATRGGTVAAIDGADGSVAWRTDLGEFAAVHASGDGDGDGEREVYAVGLDGELRSLRASDGSVEWTTTLTTGDVQMMPPPALGDVDGDGQTELVAVTNDGLVSVVDPASGEILATYEREVRMFTRPTLFDADGDGIEEIFAMYGDGRVVSLSYRE